MQIHDDAAERLITKLLLNPALVGNDKAVERAKLIDTFMEEYADFTNRRGIFAKVNIWIIATDESTRAHKWHNKYSHHQTKVLGKLACLVLEKILGIGTAEQNWKQVKAVKSGQRVNTSIEKTKKQFWCMRNINRCALRHVRTSSPWLGSSGTTMTLHA